MKVLILSQYYSPDLSAGSFRMSSFVRSLVDLYPDIEFELLTTMPNRYNSFKESANEVEKVDKLTIHRFSLPHHNGGMRQQIFSYIHYYRYVFKVTKNKDYDLIFATSSRLFTATLGAYLSWRKRIPLYLDIRDIFVDSIGDVLSGVSKLFITPPLKLIERLTLGKALRINLVSEGFYSYFKNKYPKSKFTFISNGIDDIFMDSKNEQVHDNSDKVILYAGNIGEGQGLDRIIPMISNKLGHGFKLKIIGDGGRKKALELKLRDLKVDNVEVCNPVERSKLIQEYQKADVLFLHLNSYDAFKKVLPSKIFEYAATGKPIWAGVNGYAKEFLEKEVENTTVFTPCDANDAINSFKKLKLEVIDREKFKEKFSRKKLMDELAKEVISLLPGY